MPPPHPLMRPEIRVLDFSVEILYAVLIIAICLFIYFKTKELYSLSGHKGLGFFRQTFLFFALAYALRLIPLLFRLSDLHLPGLRIGFFAGTLLFAYVSSMALLSLARSVSWKYLKGEVFGSSPIYHLVAVIISLTLILLNTALVFFLSQIILLCFVLVASVIFHKKATKRKLSKKKSAYSYYTYVLLAVFWTLNILSFVLPQFLSELKLGVYCVSLLVFLLVLLRVLRR